MKSQKEMGNQEAKMVSLWHRFKIFYLEKWELFKLLKPEALDTVI